MEKRGKGKEIVLLALAVVLVFVVGFTFLSKATPPSGKPTPAAADRTSPTKTAKAAAQKTELALPTPQALLGKSPGNSSTRNPFTTPAQDTSVVRVSLPTEQARTTLSLPGFRTMGRSMQGMMPDLGSAIGSIFNFGDPLARPGTGPKAADQSLRASGVVVSDTAMAVLRKGEKRYFVRRGDRVDGAYVVNAISHTGVALKSTEGKTIYLRLGEGE